MKWPSCILALILITAIMPNVLASTAATRENIPSEGVGLSVAVLDYDPAPAQPGKFITVYIKAENSGGRSIADAKFVLVPKYPFTIKKGEPAEKAFGSIGARQQVLLEYELLVDYDAVEGTYEMPLRLCNNYDCSSYVETPVQITVNPGGTPKIEVGMEDFDIISPATTGEVTLHVVNRGNLNTKFVVLDLVETDDFELLTPSNIYIGELESDDFETADFKLYIKPTDKRAIDLPVRVQYTDVNDKDYDQTHTLRLKIFERDDLITMGLAKESNAPTYIAIVVLLIIIYTSFRIVNFMLRKRKGNVR